ncbi:pericentriolar material 1 protein-like isoform X2 [Acanthaster planci]|uniref:Pericentriolar material 1 protein-like isoform X2 n=1 Tax=Acanthaster planci TaxID=133434 RepID=A0A8B7XUA2_ACAPL|nr:pericentriolar material 1 protein-like isoform X2 [Acanthaster planci]
MATGGATMLKGVASEPRVRPSGSRVKRPLGGVDDNFRFNWIGDKDEDRPNNYWDWRPSSTFAEPPLERRAAAAAPASGKKSKTKNKDREKTTAPAATPPEPALASPPSREPRRHLTPATYPRTRNVGSARERLELEQLKRELTYSDMEERSTEGQAVAANNARRDVKLQTKRAPGPVNHADEMPLLSGANRQKTPSGNESGNVNEMPDRNLIVARLMQIRDYMKQAASMLANLNVAPAGSDEQAAKLVQLQAHLQEQERAYLALLERMLSDEAAGRSSHNSNESQSTSIAESTSINIDAQSDISDATTEGTFTARTRPKIESQLGNYPSDVEYASGSEASVGHRDDDASSISSRNSELASALGTMELHEQFSAMLRKYEEQGEQDEVPVARETVAERRASVEDEEELASAMSTLTAHSAEPVEGNVDIKTRLEELEGLRQQHDLLKKMLQQQEELRALQNRQNALMKLQQDIEGRLRQSEDQNADTTSQSTLDVSVQSEPTEEQLPGPRLAASDYSRGGGVPDLSERRRELLKKILSEDAARRAPEMQRARMLDRLEMAEREQNEMAAMNSEHEDLLSTLHALQQKKNHMDELLRQLQELRPSIPGAADTDSAVSGASSSHLLQPAELQQGEEVKEAQLVGSSDENEAMDKLRRLQEVRQRLDDLRDLVQQYQSFDGASGPLPGVDETGDARKASSSVNYEDPELMTNLRRLERGEPVGRFQLNQAMQEQLDTTEDGTSTQQSEDDSQQVTTDTESNQSLLFAWGHDPEIRGKIKKLQAAKRKLRELQELVALVQQRPETAVSLPEELAALAASLQEDADAANDQNEDDEEEEGGDEEEEGEEESNQTTSEMSEEVPQVSQETREAYFEAKMQQQRRELDKLQEERHRLLAVQQQLRDLNRQLPRSQQALKSTNTTRQNPSVLASLRQQAETSVEDDSSPSHQTLIAEKLRHRRLQTELKLKQQELAALMDRVKRNNTGDMNSDSGSAQGDSNDNDLFRVSMRSADVTAAASWGGSTQQSEDDEDDAYPSDGIQQVEEEEEREQSLAGTSSTYTIDNAYHRPLPRPNSFPGQTIGNSDQAELEALHGIRYPKWVSDPRLRASLAAAKRQQNLRAAEELMAEDGSRSSALGASLLDTSPDRGFYHWQIQQLQQQLQNSIGLCQSMLRDQQCMNNMLQSSMSGGFGGMPLSAHTPTFGSATPTPTNSDPRLANLMNDYNMRLQHQQLQLNMNYAYNQLYQQQQELQRLQTAEGTNPGSRPLGFEGTGDANINNNRMNGLTGYETSTFTPFASTSPYGAGLYQPGGFLPSDPLDYTSPYGQPSLDSASRRRQRDYDAYARHRQEQDALQRDYHVPPNTAQGSVDQFDMSRDANPGADYSRLSYVYTERAPEPSAGDQATRQAQPFVPPLDIQSLLERSEKRRQMAQQGSTNPTSKKSNLQASGAKPKVSAGAGRPSSDTRRGPRPGLSSSLSGTAFLDVASMASSTMSMSSMPGDVERQTRLPDTQRSLLSTSEMESDAGSEFSLFEALRESIYSEVATLISQNESRPHFLIELFRELQLLNSDYLRQRAIYSLQDLVSKFLTEDSVHVPKGPAVGSASTQLQQRQDPRTLWQMSTTASEHTPSESMITSEEDEIKAQIYRTNPKKAGKKMTAQHSKGSLDAEEFDYVESVGSASSLSTPPSFSQDFGFANDELGDTVIHLDKALQRMREYERLKAEAEASAAISSDASASMDKAAVSNSEVTSNSSAQDMGSESSFSDLPYPRIDTRQLDLQIKNIMQEVIPYLKEHMDDVCSPQLLAYIRRLVLTLSKQRDDSREFVRFFNRQLGSILQDSLAKFSGRKMRECGEDLLVDISEILFNELAFFRLMQDLDSAGSKLKQEAVALDEEDDEDDEEEEEREEDDGVTGTETGTEAGTAAEEEGSDDEGSSSEAESDASSSEEAQEPSAGSKAAASPKPAQKPAFDEVALETAMDMATSREAEELGKTRDDDLARKLEASDRDEDSESALSKDQVKIELSMSETNAVTYLGSGEDDDEYDELSAREDETITSIGAATAQENNQSSEPSAEPDSTHMATPKAEGNAEDDSATTGPEREPQAQPPDASGLPNGSMEADDEEVTIDDLPPKMTSLAEVDINSKASEEQAPSAVLQSIIDTIVSGEAALAGDPTALKEPPTANGAPVLTSGGGDATTQEATRLDAVQPDAVTDVQENGT